MFKITITASLTSKPHLIEAARKLESMGARRVRVDQFDTRQRHPRRSETLAGARLRFAVEEVDSLKKMIEAAGIANYGTTHVKKKFDSDEEDDE